MFFYTCLHLNASYQNFKMKAAKRVHEDESDKNEENDEIIGPKPSEATDSKKLKSSSIEQN